jgi:hypothetical protein
MKDEVDGVGGLGGVAMGEGRGQMGEGRGQTADGKWPRGEGRGLDSDCVSLTCSCFRTPGEGTQTLHWLHWLYWLYWLFLYFGGLKPLICANPR